MTEQKHLKKNQVIYVSNNAYDELHSKQNKQQSKNENKHKEGPQ